jgi:hypothetical protein
MLTMLAQTTHFPGTFGERNFTLRQALAQVAEGLDGLGEEVVACF